jgi:catechol 2,3-dioxygenase-like lactoylglutathione lyase family enzyme
LFCTSGANRVRESLPITGISHIDLSVRDREASSRWYVEVLGFEIHKEARNKRFGFPFTIIVHPRARLSMALVEHPQNDGGAFSEFRSGLDHLSFELPAGTDLEAWSRDLAARGYHPPAIDHDGDVPLVVLRDPDNIQVELYAGPLND